MHFENVNIYWEFYEEFGYEGDYEEGVFTNDYNLISKGPPASTSDPEVTPPRQKTSAPTITRPP